MVWPILISVELTPRISAPLAVNGQNNTQDESQADNAATPNVVTMRMCPSPICFFYRLMVAALTTASLTIPLSWKHAMAPEQALSIIAAASCVRRLGRVWKTCEICRQIF
jgi:hypothetical protein